MLDPALINYKPSVRCQPGTGERMTHARLGETEKRLRKERSLKRTARLTCSACGDKLKIHLENRWVCRHCLVPMIDPKDP